MNASFQISPHINFSLNDLHYVYLTFNVKKDFIHTSDTQLANPTIMILGDKHATYFIVQVQICSLYIIIFDNLDFLDEVNILIAMFSDEIKRKYPMIST
jgi:hypothetical protein